MDQFWYGLFNRDLHKVRPQNVERLSAQGRTFALSECGVACIPGPASYKDRLLCLDCTVRSNTDAIPVIPPQLSQQLMERVLAGLQRL